MNHQSTSSPAKDMFRGALIGAAVAAVVAVFMNKDTRRKITKSVKDTVTELQKRAEEMGEGAKEKFDKTTKQMEEKFPKKETPMDQP